MKNSKKWKIKVQLIFFETLGDFIKSGYSVNKSMELMSIFYPEYKEYASVNNKLEKGDDFATALAPYLEDNIILQIKVAQSDGKLQETLEYMTEYMSNRFSQQTKIKQVLKYPLVLIVGLLLVLIMVKTLIYPIISQWGNSTYKIDGYITLVESSVVFISIMFLIFGLYFSKLESLKKIEVLAKFKGIGQVVKLMTNYQLANQISMMLGSGIELSRIADIYSHQNYKLASTQIAQIANSIFQEGGSITDVSEKLPFFSKSLLSIFIKGADQNALSIDLRKFANLEFKRLIKQVDSLIGIIQPVLFVLIGLAIMGVYLVLLLPMYSSIGGLSK
jgi:competence protein ComGB